jgi:hypothetical protein
MKSLERATVTIPTTRECRAIVDTHRHPVGPKIGAKMAKAGFYDPKKPFPHTNPQDFVGLREFLIWTTPCPYSARAASPSALSAMAARWSGSRKTYSRSAPATPSSS